MRTDLDPSVHSHRPASGSAGVHRTDLKCLIDNVRSGLIEQDRHDEGNQAER
jgi:hypothetical protein